MNPAADLAIFYAAFPAVNVTHTPRGGGAVTPGRAIFDQPGMTVINNELLATDLGLRFPAASFPAVRKGDTFAIADAAGVFDGHIYTARENAQPTQDGDERTVSLAKS